MKKVPVGDPTAILSQKRKEKGGSVQRNWRKASGFMKIEQKVRKPYISKCVKKVCGLDLFLTREGERTERSS